MFVQYQILSFLEKGFDFPTDVYIPSLDFVSD